MASKISTRGNNVSVTHSFFPNRHTRKEKDKTSGYFLLSLRCLLQTYCCLIPSSIKIVSEYQINQKTFCILLMELPRWLSVVKNLLANAEDEGSIPGQGRYPRGGNDNSLHFSCLENPIDRAAWWATVQGITKQSDRTQGLNNNNSLNGCIRS